MMLTASWLGMNSHTPSLARMMKASRVVSVRVKTSGSEVTPTLRIIYERSHIHTYMSMCNDNNQLLYNYFIRILISVS